MRIENIQVKQKIIFLHCKIQFSLKRAKPIKNEINFIMCTSFTNIQKQKT